MKTYILAGLGGCGGFILKGTASVARWHGRGINRIGGHGAGFVNGSKDFVRAECSALD